MSYKNMMKILDFLIIFFVLACFIFLSIYKIDLPGLYEDEAFRAMPALEILHNKIFLPNLYSFDIFNRHFPIMLTPFQGAFNSYVLVPIGSIFGLSVKVIRISQVFFAAIGVLLTFILCRKLFGKNIAMLTAILLAINPSFILFNRQGLLVSSIDLPITISAILLISQWYSRENKLYLYSGFFLFGVALFNNANFFWLITALIASCWIVFKKEIELLFADKKLDTNLLVASFYFLLLGAAPFIWYNIQYWETPVKIIENFGISYKNDGLLWYFKALSKNIETFIFMLSGAYHAGSYGYSKGIINHTCPLLFLVSIICGPFLFIKQKNAGSLKKFLFLVLVIVFIFLQAPFSFKDSNAYNLYITYPVVQIITAIFLVKTFYFLKNDPAAVIYFIIVFFAFIALFGMFIVKGYLHPLIVVGFLLLTLYFFIRGKNLIFIFHTIFACLFIFLELATIYGYYKAVNKNGGVGLFSNASYGLGDFLKKKNALNPIAMDWGFRNRLLVLTNGEVDCKEFYYQVIKNKKYFKRVCGKLLEKPQLLYLVNPPDLDGTGVWPLFRKITPSENSSLKEIKRFNQKDGKWVFSVYKQCYKFDFIDNFTKAKIKKRGSESVTIEDFFVKGDNKKVIFSHPLSEIRYDLKLPDNPFIKFSIGIAENSWDKTDGVLGKIYIISDGKETEIFSKYLNPQYNLEDRKWLDYEIDLSGFSNKKVSIVFKTFPGPIAREEGDYTADWWGWGEPALIERYEENVD